MELQSSITPNTPFRSSALRCCNYFYDSLSALISILDVITDIMILVYYLNTPYIHRVFFLLSLCILLFAQLSYAILFIKRFASHLAFRYKVICFLLVLPICPIMSILFFWASLPHNKLSKMLTLIGLRASEYEQPSESQAEKLGITKLQEYFAMKQVSHLGFVLEAICESFPQSILQCTAMILYYNQGTEYYNVLTFISILISLISISSKALMFSGSLNISTFFFNWLCAVCDFFGLYLIFVWVFFVPDILDSPHNGHGEYSLSLFGEVWLWKFIICTVIPIVVVSVICTITIAIDRYDDITLDMYQESACEYITKFWIILGITIIAAVLWSVSVIFLIIFGEVLCCTWIPIAFYAYNESRYSHSRTFMKIFHWLYLAPNKKDRLIRLIAINYRLSHRKMMNDAKLHKFLNNVIENEMQSHGNSHSEQAVESGRRCNRCCCCFTSCCSRCVASDRNRDGNVITLNVRDEHLVGNGSGGGGGTSGGVISTLRHSLDGVVSDKDPELFDFSEFIPPMDSMLFEPADDTNQQKQLSDYYEEYEGTEKLRDFGTSLLTDEDYSNCTVQTLQDVTYKDFRTRCKNRHKTHLDTLILKQMLKSIEEDKVKVKELKQQQSYVRGISGLEVRMARWFVYFQLFCDYILWFIFVPLYAVSRLFTLLIPLIGMFLIQDTKYIQFPQWILTAFFFVIVLSLCLLSCSVCKFQFLAWHIAPGYDIISPKIHNDSNEEKRRTVTLVYGDGDESVDRDHHHQYADEYGHRRGRGISLSVMEMEEEEEHTTTLEEILSDRSSAQNSSTQMLDVELSVNEEADNPNAGVVVEDENETLNHLNDSNQQNDDTVDTVDVSTNPNPINNNNDHYNGDSRSNRNNGNGTRTTGARRARRLRRKHKRQQKKQRKKKMKRIKERIRQYEKLEFYEWVKKFYVKLISVPEVRKLVHGRFGKDIGNVILEYLPSIMEEDDNFVVKEVETSKTMSDSYPTLQDPIVDDYGMYGDEMEDDREDMDEIGTGTNNSSFNPGNMLECHHTSSNMSNRSYRSHSSHQSLVDEDLEFLFHAPSKAPVAGDQRNSSNVANVDLTKMIPGRPKTTLSLSNSL